MNIAEKLIKVAENVPKVYEAGQKSENDRFWDAFQQNGSRTDYASAFRTVTWTIENFKPKYDIRPVGNTNTMFFNSNINADLVELLETLGIELDFSKVTMLGSGFQGSKFTRIGEIDCSSFTPTGTTSVFYNCTALKIIDKIIVNEDITLGSWFNLCSALEEIRFEGTIGKNLDIHWGKKLSMTSLANIVDALSDTVTGQTITFPTTAESNYDSKTYIGRWKEVVASKPNWTFAYA
jgi:hypothetical protein